MSTKLPTGAEFERALAELGFSNHEARAYVALLGRGTSTVTEVARGAGIKRTTAYTVLEALKNRGYVSTVPRGSRKRYAASHPEALSTMLVSRLDQFRNLLPAMTALYNLRGAAGTTRIYEGQEAISEVYELLLRSVKPGEPYLVISNVELWYKQAPQYFSQFVERRSRLGLKPRHIFSDSKSARPWLKRMQDLGASGKIFPGSIDFSINMVIVPRLVVIHQLVPPVQAVVIESPVVADMLRQIYEIVWAALPDS